MHKYLYSNTLYISIRARAHTHTHMHKDSEAYTYTHKNPKVLKKIVIAVRNEHSDTSSNPGRG